VTDPDEERAQVRVRCDGCGPQVIPLSGIRLLHRAERSVYMFTCDQCGLRNRRPADASMRAVLRSAGAVELRLHNAADS
jgi:hypothetical protein